MIVRTLMEELLFYTVKLDVETDDGSGEGTAFLVSWERAAEDHVFLVTNKHVVKGARTGAFRFLEAASENEVRLGHPIDLELDDFESRWHLHPSSDIDVCVMPMDDILKTGVNSSKPTPFYRTIGSNLFPTDHQLTWDMRALQGVGFVGYPAGLYDSHSLLPIARTGITATPFEVDFEDRPEFLIDATVLPGSSGSPVFIIPSGRFSGGPVIWAGILSETVVVDKELQVRFRPIPTKTRPLFDSNEDPIGIGVVIKLSKVLQTIESYFS